MKPLWKIISLVLTLVLCTCTAFAAANEQYADTLYELGLFKGTDKGYELENTLTREQAATVLVRLLGEENNAEANDYSQVFDDVESDRWSFPYVMYCYENEITKGTGEDTFSPAASISGGEFVTLVLRLLGYTDAEPETAFEDAVYRGVFNSSVAAKLKTATEFLRDDMVYIVYRSLMTKTADGAILADVLAEKEVITENQAQQFDVYNSTDDIDELLEKLLN